MSTIIKATGLNANARPAVAGPSDPFEGEAFARSSDAQDWLRGEAARIIAEAKCEAEFIRRQAAEDGRLEAERMAEDRAARREQRRWETLLPALQRLGEEMRREKQAWLSRWEHSAVELGLAIARRVLRRALPQCPETPLTLAREALELASGVEGIRVCFCPADHRELGGRIEAIARELGVAGPIEVAADESVSPGGCRVETRFGRIDQQFEAQLARIAEELV